MTPATRARNRTWMRQYRALGRRRLCPVCGCPLTQPRQRRHPECRSPNHWAHLTDPADLARRAAYQGA